MCMVDGCDEFYSLYKGPKATKARKGHKCDECGRQVVAGETYYTASGMYEGEFNFHKICQHCYVACEWLKQNCSGFLHCAVLDDIEEHVEEYGYTKAKAVAGLARILIGMRRDWVVKRGPRVGQLMPLPKLPAPLEPTGHH